MTLCSGRYIDPATCFGVHGIDNKHNDPAGDVSVLSLLHVLHAMTVRDSARNGLPADRVPDGLLINQPSRPRNHHCIPSIALVGQSTIIPELKLDKNLLCN